jgi:hypothetical protein
LGEGDRFVTCTTHHPRHHFGTVRGSIRLTLSIDISLFCRIVVVDLPPSRNRIRLQRLINHSGVQQKKRSCNARPDETRFNLRRASVH